MEGGTGNPNGLDPEQISASEGSVQPSDTAVAIAQSLAKSFLDALQDLERRFVEDLDEEALNQVVSYRTSKGQPFSNSLLDILTHLSLHSHYHRGQIAARIRDMGGEPAQSDYIFYVRERDTQR